MADDKTPEDDNPYTQTYVVKPGDSLSKIAQHYYGDASLYDKIFQANRDVLKDPNKIQVGQKLRIP
jgi:nucleoid-associated protein YgaU